MKSNRIGILGGTFNPIHTGHLILAQECWYQLSLDKVIFMPAFMPPHKQLEGDVSAADRLNMVRIALAVWPFLPITLPVSIRATLSSNTDVCSPPISVTDTWSGWSTKARAMTVTRSFITSTPFLFLLSILLGFDYF